MKKLCSLCLVLIFSVGLFAIPAASEETVIDISTAQQLSDIRNDLTASYRLINDIVFTAADFAEGGAFYNNGEGWDPIGTSYTATKAFTGTLDGNGYTISGLYIHHTGTGSNAKFAGLFGHMNGTVKNLSLDEVDITVQNTKSARAGAVAGQCQGTVQNVAVDGEIQCLSIGNTAAVGGVVGRQTKTAILSGCLSAVNVTVTGNTVRLGGLLGENEGGIVLGSQTTGAIDGNATYTLYIGGIVGHNHSATSGSAVTIATVSNCLRDGETVGFAKSSLIGGGLVGWNESGTINDCITLQTIDFSGDTGLAGGQVVGKNASGTVSRTYYVENNAEFSALGDGDSISTTQLPTAFDESDISGLLNDDTFWAYQDGTLVLKDLPKTPALRAGVLLYTVNADGKTATITGCETAAPVTVPLTANGYPITAIAASVFTDQAVSFEGDSTAWAAIAVADGNTALASVVCLGDITFSGASLTLHNNLTVNYKVDAALFEEQGFTDPYVVFTFNGTTVEVRDYTVADDRYVFDFTDIAPHLMNDTIYAALHVTRDGVEYVGTTSEYSIATYCYSMLETYSSNEYAALRTLLVDLLRYGSASQLYVGHRTDALADADLTPEQVAWGTATVPTKTSVFHAQYRATNDPEVRWKSAGLYLRESVSLRFTFQTAASANLSVRIRTANGEWVIPQSEFIEVDGGYSVLFDGLGAAHMNDTVYVTVCRGSLPISHTLRYSVESYVYAAQSSSSDATLCILLDALLNYGNAAKVYAAIG